MSEAANRDFSVEVRPYRGRWRVVAWAWTAIYGTLNYGGDPDYGPARVCLVRRADGSVAFERRCFSASKVAGFKAALEDELAGSTSQAFAMRHRL